MGPEGLKPCPAHPEPEEVSSQELFNYTSISEVLRRFKPPSYLGCQEAQGSINANLSFAGKEQVPGGRGDLPSTAVRAE